MWKRGIADATRLVVPAETSDLVRQPKRPQRVALAFFRRKVRPQLGDARQQAVDRGKH